ncbi:MAG TPA: hypothetical protein DD740_12305 [Chryseobacterium sp.]|nr:hypothetical protein [Chryseobacterium sp.]
MKKYQESVYKIILIFSVIVNLFLLVLMFLVARDSLSGTGEWLLQGRSFWFFIGVIAAYTLANALYIFRLLKLKSYRP